MESIDILSKESEEEPEENNADIALTAQLEAQVAAMQEVCASMSELIAAIKEAETKEPEEPAEPAESEEE